MARDSVAVVRERERQVVEMRLAGVPWAVIAERVGYADKSVAYNTWRRVSERMLKEPVEELRQLTSDRLEALLQGVWRDARSGDTRAVETARRLLDQYAKLHGLYAPVKVEADLSVQVGQTAEDEEVAALARDIARRRAELRGLPSRESDVLDGDSGAA